MWKAGTENPCYWIYKKKKKGGTVVMSFHGCHLHFWLDVQTGSAGITLMTQSNASQFQPAFSQVWPRTMYQTRRIFSCSWSAVNLSSRKAESWLEVMHIWTWSESKSFLSETLSDWIDMKSSHKNQMQIIFLVCAKAHISRAAVVVKGSQYVSDDILQEHSQGSLDFFTFWKVTITEPHFVGILSDRPT